ncbi:hypothetical protein EDC01DRAFT_624203 [Geopyxis carbonaria]|nr:hypothetical protein EDC01DRAFT_624203 [Geopyxis carbonaria]
MLKDYFQELNIDVDLDDKFIGLTALSVPGSGYDIVADIIAIHGIGGHAFGSWKSPKGSSMWLRDYLPNTIKNARILTYGYDTKLAGSYSTASFLDIARKLLEVVKMSRDDPTALIDAESGSEDDMPIFHCSYGLIFFGVPSRGMKVDHLSTMVEGQPNADLVRFLSPDSAFLIKLCDDFFKKFDFKDSVVVSIYETKMSKTIENKDGTFSKTGPEALIVHKSSATQHTKHSESNPISIDADHQQIVKFESQHNWDYLKVQDCLKKMVQHAPRGIRERVKPCNTKINSHFIVPLPKNPNFIGGMQSQIQKKLEQSGHRRVAIYGLGGIGKTQESLNYVYGFFESETSVFWVHAGSKTRFQQDYCKIAAALELPGIEDPKVDICNLLKIWFEGPKSGTDWILVLDNADNANDFFDGNDRLEKYIPFGSKGKVIVTTRDSTVAGQLCQTSKLEKETMKPAEARTLFNQNITRGSDFTPEDCAAIPDLLRELNYLPLAVVHTASYIEQITTSSPEKYLKQFKNSKTRQKLLSRKHKDVYRDAYTCGSSQETILKIFEINFRQIETQSPLAGYLLKIIGCIDAQGIPHAILKYGGMCATEIAEDIDDQDLDEAISKLINFSFLKEHEVRDDLYEMHPLVHTSIGDYLLQNSQMSDFIEKTAHVLTNVLPIEEPFPNMQAWRIYIPHVSTFKENIKQESSEDIASVYSNIGNYYSTIGAYSQAECALKICRELRENILGPEHPDTLASMNYLSFTFGSLGRYGEAEKLAKLVLDLRKKVLGPEHPDTLASMGSLAWTFKNLGRYGEAEKLEKLVLDLRKKVLGPEHPDTLATMGSLASTFRSLGRYEEAEKLQKQVLDLSNKVLGPEHPDTLASMGSLAWTFKNLGRYGEAEKLQKQTLDLSNKVLGPEHPYTLTTMGNLATTFMNLGRYEEAEKLQKQVLDLSKKILGPEHPYTLASMNHLSSTFGSLGRYEEAEKLQKQVLDLRKKILGPEHPYTLASMNHLSSTFGSLGRYEEAEKLQKQVLDLRKKILGLEHPDTLFSMDSLARIYHDSGNFDKALELMEETVTISSKVMPNHPNTLQLAKTLRWLKRKKTQRIETSQN